MAWWHNNQLRLIQNNLREIDADLDVDLLISQLKQFDANVLMLNAGGIFAFYPSKLEHHYVTPYLKKDLLREAIDKAHANGMRFIARFDFSKTHESLFADKPEWYYRTKEGKEVNYHGIVHTCINGGYQQEHSLKIIEEVLDSYAVDGIFFNMFGYQTKDYSGNDYGLCYCDNCKRRFRAMYGTGLPENRDPNNEVYQQYKKFQSITTKEILDSVHEMVKRKNPEIALCTYHTHQVDIVRNESNTALHRPHPVWQYSASENVKSIEDGWDDKLISNCCINAIDLTYRFTGVSANEVQIRLYESIASGSGLDFCIIGIFDGYPDQENITAAQEVYRFHKENEKYFGSLGSMADVALIKPDSLDRANPQEYFGWFKMLKEQHIQFDVVPQGRLSAKLEQLKGVQAVIVPGIRNMDNAQLAALKELQHSSGVRIMATGHALTGDERNREMLYELFQAKYRETITDTIPAYLETSDKEVFRSFPARDWVIVGEGFSKMSFEGDQKTLLPFVLPSTFGPPERAYGHQRSSEYGVGVSRERGAYLPWEAGTLYYRYGYEDHKRVLTDLLHYMLDGRYAVTTDAPQAVELFYNKIDDSKHMLQLLNLTGFNGVTYSDPIAVAGIQIVVGHGQAGKNCKAYSLMRQKYVPTCSNQEGITLVVETLELYDAIVLEFSE
ncbi:alpha-amylase family protein [Paenibacillus radicis (ex Xue et al. 2023)]|uniref:Family 10 glycosylhydrolase n=1 Tax=Paenibacillus radicis (ex Xue et al. 2023) TaxID=2972489 RepID=A0ABT1YH27_9BACL|nr:alpha-amylase family protein [Paenibacillus radicis (ex Xue et al. 2023)]MCR8632509.1 family 10 glycosylhydrolase [Paenibacillus radicis (ex Xue et al. 2023)]